MKLGTTIKAAAIAVGVLALGFAQSANAATATTTFAVTASVTANCTISASPLAFGAYTGAVVNNQTTLSVTCTNTTPYSVGLSAGTSTGATVSTRKMTGAASTANLLNYSLFRDSGRTLNWGVTTTGTPDVQPGTGNGTAQSITVYGQVPAGQNVAPDNYSDTITATVNY